MKKTNRVLFILDILAGLGMISGLVLIFFYTPVEETMGMVQKLFYFHVASTWMGMLGFLLAVVASIAYVSSRDMKWDAMAVAGNEIGMVFVLIGIITGSIWAKPIWNTWWTWDSRLTTTLIMELIYASYFILRGSLNESRQRARFSAIYSIAGFITVPLTFLSIRIFRSIHPVIIGSTTTSSGMFAMSARMQFTFFYSLGMFSLFFVAVFWHRFILEQNLRVMENNLLEEE